jgi:hypothetical protein
MNKKFIKNILAISAVLIAISLIPSSSISMKSGTLSEKENLDLNVKEEKTDFVNQLTGLNPLFVEKRMAANSLKSTTIQPSGLLSDDGYFYACDVFSPYPVVKWELETGDGKETLASSGDNQYFLAGGDWSCDEVWYGCEYNTGSLWTIDPDTGDMEHIGGGGTSVNGLAFDPIYNRLYGLGSGSLYEYDPETGEQEFIGSYGVSNTMISLVIDMQGVAWAYDVLFNGYSTLFNIDLETGEATMYCDMGQNLCYAQDCAIDYDTGIIWMCAYSDGGFYAYWNWDAEEIVTVTTLDSQYACAMIRSPIFCGYDDVGVKNIIYPKNGYALSEIPMKVTVKNYGWASSEVTDVQMKVNKFEAGPKLLEEDFSGHFPPDGWTTDYWNQSFTNESGGESPEARCYNLDHPQGQYYDSYIISPKFNCSNAEKVELSFKFKADIEYTFCSFFIKYRKNSNQSWIDVTPWINPFPSDFGPKNYVIDIYGDPYLGEEFQVKWEYEGYYSYFNYWWLDDVDITAYSVSIEYNETVDDVEIYSGEEVFVDFPVWTPTDWQDPDFEDSWQEYIVKSSTLLKGDDNPENDCKEKIINLYFPWMHDIEITSIDSPCENGPGQTYPVQAKIKNVGQYTECCIHIDINISDLISEYSDSACQGESIEPGETRTFNFDNWTPDFLQNETTGSTEHTVNAEIHMFGDKNPGNDMITEDFKLDYWHDVGIDGISSPNFITRKDDLIWHNGDPDGRSALPGSIYQGYSNVIIDDFVIDSACILQGGAIRFIWYSGGEIGNLDTLYMWFFEETGDCEPSKDAYIEKLEVTDFAERLTGDYYFDRPEIEVFVSFEEVYLPAGNWWVGFQPDSVGEDIAYLLTAEGWECDVMADLPYWDYPRWSSSQEIWEEGYDLSWQLQAWGHPFKHITIPPGPQDISAIAKNYGTFPELDLVCNAQIWDYIFDPENGTKLFEENETDINLDTPLGGELLLNFGEFNFEHEGRYGLYFSMPDDNDDFPKNNKYRRGIGVDNTSPISSHILDPPDPDGENGWYVNDLEVTLSAYDPYSMDVSSGVDMIHYRVNDGPTQTIDGEYYVIGTFLITQADDRDDVKVEYWAVDNVANEETPHHTFTIDMDQTDPTVDLTYEVVSGNPIQGWVLEFTATCSDTTSGMDRVEFYLNNLWQETVIGSGPIYQWDFIYHGDLNIDVRADAYDIAGNIAKDIVENPVSYNFNQSNQQQSQSQTSSFFINNNISQRLYVIYGGGYK